MKRELGDLLEAIGIGEYFFAEHFAQEARPGVHELAADAIPFAVVDAMFGWRDGIRRNFEAAIEHARRERNELLASQLERIFDDVVHDDAVANQTYKTPANTTRPAPEYLIVFGLLRRREKIRVALKALVKTLEAS